MQIPLKLNKHLLYSLRIKVHMALVTKTNHTFLQTAQPAFSPEAPITTILPELLEYILIFTNQSENTRLVSRHWNVLTFTAFIKFKTQELKQTIQLITERLDPGAQCTADLVNFQNTHHFVHEGTFAKVRNLFLADKGLVIGMFRKLPEKERDQLQIAIGNQLPDSMKNLFMISKLAIWDVRNVDRETLFTLLQSYQPISIKDRQLALLDATQENNIEFVKLLLADGPITDIKREVLLMEATCHNLEVFKLLLASGPISETTRAIAIKYAVKNNNLEIVQLLRKPLIWRIVAVVLKIAAFVSAFFAAAAVGIYAHEYFSKNRS
jgi:hypothetical protein